MSVSGHVENGVVVFDGGSPLPEGTKVTIAPVQPDVARQPEAHGHDSSFWTNKTVDELAWQQRVTPVRSVEELAGDWPPEDSHDDFLTFIREARH
jgi:hypothetical protein